MAEILRVERLKKHFVKESALFTRRKTVYKAVNDVSFHIDEGETLGLVGESGCGKSTTGRVIVDLIRPTDGKVCFEGRDISQSRQNKEDYLKVRRNIQMIFQDAYASLDPRRTARQAVAEALDIHKICMDSKERDEYISKVFADSGLMEEQKDRYPHEFSGGQRQRIGIARAISLKPKVIICDEPVSALDVSVQAQIINNMNRIQKLYGIAYLFISHDLSVVKHISDRIIVMYLGFIVEEASKTDLYSKPLHPYTQMLIEATPRMDTDATKQTNNLDLTTDNNIDPSLIDVCCAFSNRCPSAMPICRQQEPQIIEMDDGHKVRCHLYNKE